MSFGTLLGAVRNQSIIPWTMDADFVVHGHEFDEMKAVLRSSSLLDRNGYLYFDDPKYKGLGRVCITKGSRKFSFYEENPPKKGKYFDNYPYVDLYPMDVKLKYYIRVRYGPACKYDLETIFPITKIPLLGREINAPRNYTQYLRQLYGPEYMKPPSRTTMHGLYKDACKDWDGTSPSPTPTPTPILQTNEKKPE